MSSAIAIRLGIAVGLAVLLPAPAPSQAMAPLPPDCDVRGSRTLSVAARHAGQQASLVVLPLSVGAGTGPMAFLSDAFPNALANRIGSSVPRIYVVGRRAQRRRSPANEADARALSREFGVRYVLDGSIIGSRDETR